MARNLLHTIYPFAEGTDRPISEWHFITIEQETAKRAAGAEPFRVVWHAVGMVTENRFTHITDACATLPLLVAEMTAKHSGRDWSKLEPPTKGWPTDNLEPDLRKRGTLNRMRADMGWSLARAREEYANDPAQRF